jgi:hypothetical protein
MHLKSVSHKAQETTARIETALTDKAIQRMPNRRMLQKIVRQDGDVSTFPMNGTVFFSPSDISVNKRAAAMTRNENSGESGVLSGSFITLSV